RHRARAPPPPPRDRVDRAHLLLAGLHRPARALHVGARRRRRHRRRGRRRRRLAARARCRAGVAAGRRAHRRGSKPDAPLAAARHDRRGRPAHGRRPLGRDALRLALGRERGGARRRLRPGARLHAPRRPRRRPLPPPRAPGPRLRRPARRRPPRPHPRSARARGRRPRPGARPHDDGGDGGAELRGIRARLHPPPGARRPGGRLAVAGRCDVGVGATLRLDTPAGPFEAPVAGVVVDYVSPRGSVILARPTYLRWWQDRSANRFHVTLAAGASLDAVRHAIATRVDVAQGLKVLTQRELYTYHRDAVRRAFRLTDALAILPLVVAALGLAEALLAVSLDRRREFALLRAAGATRAQVAAAVVGESAGGGA